MLVALLRFVDCLSAPGSNTRAQLSQGQQELGFHVKESTRAPQRDSINASPTSVQRTLSSWILWHPKKNAKNDLSSLLGLPKTCVMHVGLILLEKAPLI